MLRLLQILERNASSTLDLLQSTSAVCSSDNLDRFTCALDFSIIDHSFWGVFKSTNEAERGLWPAYFWPFSPLRGSTEKQLGCFAHDFWMPRVPRSVKIFDNVEGNPKRPPRLTHIFENMFLCGNTQCILCLAAVATWPPVRCGKTPGVHPFWTENSLWLSMTTSFLFSSFCPFQVQH